MSFANTGGIPVADVLTYRKYAAGVPPPASLGLDESHPVSSWVGLATSAARRPAHCTRAGAREEQARWWWLPRGMPMTH